MSVQTTAYFVVVEALTNASKHAHSDRIEVRVEVGEGQAMVEVRDDGSGGVDPAQGSGLSGLADRVSALGGTLEIDSPVGAGTTIRARIPARMSDTRTRDVGGKQKSASELIDKRIAELGDWRGETLSRMRKLIKEADPDVVEEVKWVKATSPGTPTWSHDGIICTGEPYKSVVKLTFAKGASLKDPAKLFNSSLEGNTRRAIDIHEGEKVDAGAFKALIRAAVALNTQR